MQLQAINPIDAGIPKEADIQKVHTENEELPPSEHRQAVDNFMLSDSLAKGLIDDLGFIDRIPKFIQEVIDTKIWECFYVARGVVTPYYCRYTKGTDSENFRAFITAKRPNGLGTTVETLDRLLQTDFEVSKKFRAILDQSHQGQPTHLINETSYDNHKKLEDGLSQTRQSDVQAADRAAKAISIVNELLDRELIGTDIVARLGQEIKDPEKLTAEEREYIDKRDLIGLRIHEYVNSHPMPEDEDKEPQYRRELNIYVKDLLDTKDRSSSVRIDNPKKAAKKLLKHYQGEKLRELIEYLMKGLEPSPNLDLPALKPADSKPEVKSHTPDIEASADKGEPSKTSDKISEQSNIPDQLNAEELAKRCGVTCGTLSNMLSEKERDKLPEWFRKRDPNSYIWQPTNEGKGRSRVFIRLQEESVPQQE